MTAERGGATNIPHLKHEVVDQVASGDFYIGGAVRRLYGAVALKVGDSVYITTGGKVTKSAVSADYQAGIGVVVGGKLTDFDIITDWDVSAQLNAGAADDEVLVQYSGNAYIMSDAAFAVGAWVGGGAVTAGRVSAVAATSGQRLGKALKLASGAAQKIPIALQLG